MNPEMKQHRHSSAVRRIAVVVTVAAAAIAWAGPAAAQPAAGHAGMPGMASAEAKMNGSGSMQLQMAMEAMHKKMEAMKMSGKTDTDFAMMMVAHHQGAIDMAKAELASGKNPEVRKTAEKVIAAQTKEIAQLEAWLKKDAQAK
ncbi:DUF305 domain-containing protein [Massilia sp. P8910]|uniref:CopM family metallochaperone n=1 Tax=Massilia antarctica TaxID=2765360 RepID=UPI001E4B7008|nr:DUF305 domain-containing protein [Massilia antarctica]MCE3602828.1 DUF305 domain-containing protein [Massilia antarctica]